MTVIDTRKLDSDVHDAADFIVIGTGAAGATAGRALAEQGFEVLFVEEGPYLTLPDYGTTVSHAMSTIFRDHGAQTTSGRVLVPVLQGRCVGGSTVINSALVWRLPEDVRDLWRREHGIGDALPEDRLNAAFDRIEAEIVSPVTPEKAGNNNGFLQRGVDALGLDTHVTQRFERGCQGSARCLTGCPNNAKRGMHVSYIPDALKQGARLYTCCRADRILASGGRAASVACTLTDRPSPRPRTAHFHARKGIVLAASAIQSPIILRDSGLGGPLVGEFFQGHPGAGIAGIYGEPVKMWQGATQGFETIHFRKTHFYKIETVSLQPELASVRVPGFGRAFKEAMRRYGHYTICGMAVRCRALGSVRRHWAGGARIGFCPNADDMVRFRQGLRSVADIMFAGGAKQVMPGIYGLPPVVGPDQVALFDSASLDPRAYTMILNHLFGTCRMSKDPAAGVVDTNYQVHGTAGLYVVDSSVFPTNIGVNPQHSIMGLATVAAEKIGERARRPRTTPWPS